ncbi:MAG: flagellin [Treponema sp.]|nr:flagellin [Treponema sp.]
MIINHNLSAQFADRSLGVTQTNLTKDLEKLSSGLRVNRAGDDASGLAVSEKLRSQVRGLNRASSNALDGISLIQTAEGYLQETQDIVQRLRELAVQSSNGIYLQEDREQIQVEVSQLVDEINRIASHAQFNGKNLINGNFALEGGNEALFFHIGANMDQREQVFINDMSATALFAETQGAVALSDADSANSAIGSIDNALKLISKQRADLGGFQNRLEHAIRGIDIGAENLQAAESRIRDTNMAAQMVSYTKNQILSQSGTAMLAQANQRTSSVLSLIQ